MRMVRCPRCGKATVYEGNPFRPFCSEQCKMIDLGRWIAESYRIPTASRDEHEDEAPGPAPVPEDP
jgi:endogenous inhibitor of DNA gyrase (YacG/DUF329 family)